MAKEHRDSLKEANKKRHEEEKFAKMQEKLQRTVQTSAMRREERKQKREHNEVELWNKVLKGSEQMIERGHQGYDNWVSSMLQIFGLAEQLAEALNASSPLTKKIQKTQDEWLSSETYQKLLTGKEVFMEKLFGEKRPPSVPRYKLGIHFTDKDTLNLNAVWRSDNKKTSQEEKAWFYKGIVAWLHENGYKPVPNQPGVFHDQNGQRLTKSTFEALKEDPQRGLVPFLRGEYYGSDLEVDLKTVDKEEATSKPSTPTPFSTTPRP